MYELSGIILFKSRNITYVYWYTYNVVYVRVSWFWFGLNTYLILIQCKNRFEGY